ncbi:MFS transporter [Labrys monachus]|uniref:MFS family permease n=1 Tax=Labrys monachus TaxID=217067 RepID=A0ABU0FH54_9HYPH|nr:MFS transporter [Labrys monachus]MDQ0393939.1 MFS family permease [Labrys monachus]
MNMPAYSSGIDVGAPADGRDAAAPDFAPFTSGQITYTAIVALVAWTFAVYDLITFGNLLPAIQQAFQWSNPTASFVATLVGLGSLVVALAVGPMIDLVGRRFALMATTGGAAISSGLTALALGPASLVLVRALSGFGMSEQAVNAAYLNEVFSARGKGFLYGIVQAGWPLGVMLSAGLAAVLLPVIGWRGVFLVAALPLLVMLALRFGLRESPYFLKLQHLRRLKAAGRAAEAETLSGQWQLDPGTNESRNTYAPLFAPALRRHSIALGATFFFKIIADSQLTVLATSVLAQTKGIELTSALWTVFIGNGVALLGYLFFGWLGDRIGRRETVIAAQVMAAICTVLLLFVAQGFAVVVLFYALVLFFAQGAAAPFFAYVGESYPTRMRGSGAAYINVAGPVGGIFGPLIYGGLQSAGAAPAVAAASGAVAALAAALCLFAARSIRPGQNLAAISH